MCLLHHPKEVSWQRMVPRAPPFEHVHMGTRIHTHTHRAAASLIHSKSGAQGLPWLTLAQNYARRTSGKHSSSLVQSPPYPPNSTRAFTSHAGSQGAGPRVRPGTSYHQHGTEQVGKPFFVNGQRANNLGFAGHIWSLSYSLGDLLM